MTAGGRQWWVRPTPRQNVYIGSVFLVCGSIELVLLVFAGGHVVNWLAAIGQLGVGAVSFTRAFVEVRRRQSSRVDDLPSS